MSQQENQRNAKIQQSGSKAQQKEKTEKSEKRPPFLWLHFGCYFYNFNCSLQNFKKWQKTMG